MEPMISLEDLALLEVLQRIDASGDAADIDQEMRKRLHDSGLVTESADGLVLTPAGIELTKSLQHRVAADAQAKKIKQRREAGDGNARTAPK